MGTSLLSASMINLHAGSICTLNISSESHHKKVKVLQFTKKAPQNTTISIIEVQYFCIFWGTIFVQNIEILQPSIDIWWWHMNFRLYFIFFVYIQSPFSNCTGGTSNLTINQNSLTCIRTKSNKFQQSLLISISTCLDYQ